MPERSCPFSPQRLRDGITSRTTLVGFRDEEPVGLVQGGAGAGWISLLAIRREYRAGLRRAAHWSGGAACPGPRRADCAHCAAGGSRCPDVPGRLRICACRNNCGGPDRSGKGHRIPQRVPGRLNKSAARKGVPPLFTFRLRPETARSGGHAPDYMGAVVPYRDLHPAGGPGIVPWNAHRLIGEVSGTWVPGHSDSIPAGSAGRRTAGR